MFISSTREQRARHYFVTHVSSRTLEEKNPLYLFIYEVGKQPIFCFTTNLTHVMHSSLIDDGIAMDRLVTPYEHERFAFYHVFRRIFITTEDVIMRMVAVFFNDMKREIALHVYLKVQNTTVT